MYKGVKVQLQIEAKFRSDDFSSNNEECQSMAAIVHCMHNTIPCKVV